jgi:hypothetical protein
VESIGFKNGLSFGSEEIENIGTIIKNDFKAKNLVFITDKG